MAREEAARTRGLDRTKERRLLKALSWPDGLLFDLRLAGRGLRRDPAFALTAVATLTIAIALNVTVFTVMDAMLFRGLPLATTERPVALSGDAQAVGPAMLPGSVAPHGF